MCGSGLICQRSELRGPGRGAGVAAGYTAGGAKRRKLHDGGRSLRASEAAYYT